MSVRYLRQTAAPDFAANPSGDTIYVPYNAVQSMNVLYGKNQSPVLFGFYLDDRRRPTRGTPASSYTYALPGRLTGLNVLQTSGFYTR